MSIEPYRLREMGHRKPGWSAGWYDVRSCRLEVSAGVGTEPWNRVVQIDAVFADLDGRLCRVHILGMAHEGEIRIEELDANAGVRTDRDGPRGAPPALPERVRPDDVLPG